MGVQAVNSLDEVISILPVSVSVDQTSLIPEPALRALETNPLPPASVLGPDSAFTGVLLPWVVSPVYGVTDPGAGVSRVVLHASDPDGSGVPLPRYGPGGDRLDIVVLGALFRPSEALTGATPVHQPFHVAELLRLAGWWFADRVLPRALDPVRPLLSRLLASCDGSAPVFTLPLGFAASRAVLVRPVYPSGSPGFSQYASTGGIAFDIVSDALRLDLSDKASAWECRPSSPRCSWRLARPAKGSGRIPASAFVVDTDVMDSLCRWAVRVLAYASNLTDFDGGALDA